MASVAPAPPEVEPRGPTPSDNGQGPRRLHPLPAMRFPAGPDDTVFPPQNQAGLGQHRHQQQLPSVSTAPPTSGGAGPAEGSDSPLPASTPGAEGSDSPGPAGWLELAYRCISDKHLYGAPFTDEEAASWFADLSGGGQEGQSGGGGGGGGGGGSGQSHIGGGQSRASSASSGRYLTENDIAMLVWEMGIAMESGNGDLSVLFPRGGGGGGARRRSLGLGGGVGEEVGEEEFIRWLRLPDSYKIVKGLQAQDSKRGSQRGGPGGRGGDGGGRSFLTLEHSGSIHSINRLLAKKASGNGVLLSKSLSAIIQRASTKREGAFFHQLLEASPAMLSGTFDDVASETFFQKYDQTHGTLMRRRVINLAAFAGVVAYSAFDVMNLEGDRLRTALTHRMIGLAMYVPGLVAFNCFPLKWMRYARQQRLCFWSIMAPCMYLTFAVRLVNFEVVGYDVIYPFIIGMLMMTCLRMSVLYTAATVVVASAGAGFIVASTSPDTLTGIGAMIDYVAICGLTLTAVISQQHDSRLKTQALFLSETKRIFSRRRDDPHSHDLLPASHSHDQDNGIKEHKLFDTGWGGATLPPLSATGHTTVAGSGAGSDGEDDGEGKTAGDKDALVAAFALFDTDGSGFLDKTEFRYIMSLSQPGSSEADYEDGIRLPLDDAEFQSVFDAVDTDGSGNISIEEYLAWASPTEKHSPGLAAASSTPGAAAAADGLDFDDGSSPISASLDREEDEASFSTENRSLSAAAASALVSPADVSAGQVDDGGDWEFDRGRLHTLKWSDDYERAWKDFMSTKKALGVADSDSEKLPKRWCFCLCYSSFPGVHEAEYQSSKVELEQAFLQLRVVLLQIVAQEALATIIHFLQSEMGLIVAKLCFIIPVLSLVLIAVSLVPWIQKHSKSLLHASIFFYSCTLLVASYFYSIPYNGEDSYASSMGGAPVAVGAAEKKIAAGEMLFGQLSAFAILIVDTRLDLGDTTPSFITLLVLQLIFHSLTPVEFRGTITLGKVAFEGCILALFACVGAYGAQKDRRVTYMLWRTQKGADSAHGEDDEDDEDDTAYHHNRGAVVPASIESCQDQELPS